MLTRMWPRIPACQPGQGRAVALFGPGGGFRVGGGRAAAAVPAVAAVPGGGVGALRVAVGAGAGHAGRSDQKRQNGQKGGQIINDKMVKKAVRS